MLKLQYFYSYLNYLYTLIFFAVFSFNATAQDTLRTKQNHLSDKIIHYQQLAQQKNLAQQTTWQRLLYYPENQQKNVKSRVKSIQDFFVSPQGHENSDAELQAMIIALFDKNLPDNQSVQCRFPARTYWIKQNLAITDTELPTVTCTNFKKWQNSLNITSASLIFAQEYLDNPASSFAHIFLKLNHANPNQSLILNYAPAPAQNTSLAKFTYQSIFTGVKGQFTLEPYDKKIQQYRDEEGRDIWNYQLNLTHDELQQLIRQIWEIKQQDIDYFLFTGNCATEILALLNSLRSDKNLFANIEKMNAPAGVVRELQHQGLLTNVTTYEASNKTKQQAILNQVQLDILQPADNNPLHAHDLSRVSMGIGEQNNHHYIDLGYRLVYHDNLDKNSGYPVGSYLEGLSANIRIYHKTDDTPHVQLQSLNLFKSRSLNPINTADKGKSWGVNLGLERVSDGFSNPNNYHLVSQVRAEYGWSVAYGKPVKQTGSVPPNLCYLLPMGNLQVGKGLTKGYRLGIGANIGCQYQFNQNFRGLVEVSLPYWFINDKQRYWQPVATLGLQYDLAQNNALRLTTNYTYQPNDFNNHDDIMLQYLRYY